MLDLYTRSVKNASFEKNTEELLLKHLTEKTTLEEFVFMVRRQDECFNSCTECGNDLTEHEDGFLTSHGTCKECSN